MPVDTGEMDCSPLDGDRQVGGPDADAEESGEALASKGVQEASIVGLQTEIARRRVDMGTSLGNSKVGDSNSNGKVEHAK